MVDNSNFTYNELCMIKSYISKALLSGNIPKVGYCPTKDNDMQGVRMAVSIIDKIK